MSTAATLVHGLSQVPLVRRFSNWIAGVPHPHLAIEFDSDKISAVRWTKAGTFVDSACELLPGGVLIPSAVDTNCKETLAVAKSLAAVVKRLNAHDEDVTLLLPDTVIRVSLQQFEHFPRSTREAMPMLRWKLRKSLPFDAEQTVLSFMQQSHPGNGAPVVVAVASQNVVREYETLLESVGLRCGVVLSSSLAAVALLQGKQAALLARASHNTLTTAIVQSGKLLFYRCTELPRDVRDLSPQELLHEIFPVAVYYQDTWRDTINHVRLAGLGDRLKEFGACLEKELGCPVKSLLSTALADGHLPMSAKILVDHDMDAMAGWMLNEDL